MQQSAQRASPPANGRRVDVARLVGIIDRLRRGLLNSLPRGAEMGWPAERRASGFS